ncbi:MAG: proteasome assembly chaperone family protein [Euryarchaeota archaeon]|nr:proteasome assembly chaperone family protein [Euryarchaeota archaeon]
MDDGIEVFMKQKVDLKGAAVIEGFPSVGLVSTLAANYIIEQLKLPKIGCMISGQLPVTSIIRDGMPNHPVRIHGDRRVVVFISEFRPPAGLVKPIVDNILSWTAENGCELIISAEGLPVQETGQHPEEIKVYGVASTQKGRGLLGEKKIPPLNEGIITGISGVLLNEGLRLDRDVLCVIADAHETYPDARAAARIVETIDAVLPQIQLDTRPLYAEAEKMEIEIRAALAKIQPALAGHQNPLDIDQAPAGMYR